MRRSLLVLTAAGATAAVVARRRRGAVPPAGWVPAVGRLQQVLADDGVPLHVEVHGPDDAAGTVVLAHGYVLSNRLWDLQVAALRQARPDLRVVTYDQRGHGQSGRTSRAAAAIEQLGADLATVLAAVAPTGPVVLAGHSMGGMTLMALAERSPELFGDRVLGVALVATSPGRLSEVTHGMPAPVARVFAKVLPRLNERDRRREAAGRARSLAPGTARLLLGKGADPTHVRATLDVMAGCSAETVAYFLATFDDHDRVAALAALAHVRTVVLVGDKDLLCPVDHSAAIVDAVPTAELVVFPGAGHMLQLERADEVSRRLVSLCDVLPRREPSLVSERPAT